MLPKVSHRPLIVFPEERNLHFYIPGSLPSHHSPTEVDSPKVHTPQRKTNPAAIESDQDSETEVFLSPRGKTDPETPYKPFTTGSEKTITSTPQRLPDSPFPISLSPKPYKNPGTPYRKVDPPHRDPSSDPLA